MKKKVLVCASTTRHIKDFHLPYINKLAQDSENYEVKTLASCDPGMSADFNVNFEKKLLSINNFALPKKIKKILEQEKFDVIFVNTSLAAYYVRIAVKKLKCKPVVINIAHGYFFDRYSGFIRKMFYTLAEKHVRHQTDYIVTMNQEDFDYAKKHKLAKRGVYKIKGMGIDENKTGGNDCFDSANKDEYTFSFVGELSARKNQNFLIKFIKELEKLKIDAKLNLLGTGEKERKFKRLAKKLKIEDRVNFVGYTKDISYWLSKSNFYVASSKIEGLPFNILEAMQAGQIVISADTKGTVDLIQDFENGILFKMGNIKDFVYKFRIVKNDLELQRKLRENAKKTAKNYTLNAVFDENFSLFKKLIDNSAKK